MERERNIILLTCMTCEINEDLIYENVGQFSFRTSEEMDQRKQKDQKQLRGIRKYLMR